MGAILKVKGVMDLKFCKCLWQLTNYDGFKEIMGSSPHRLSFFSQKKSLRQLAGAIISIVRHWYKLKRKAYLSILHTVIPFETESLPVQVLEAGFNLVLVEEEVGSGEELEPLAIMHY
jgi:hypothetical protein